MTTKVGFFNKDGKDIIEAIYESEGKIGFGEGEEGYYKNFHPTNIDMEMILDRYNNEYYYYSEPTRRWLSHKKEVNSEGVCFDKYFLYKPSSFVSYMLPKQNRVLSNAHLEGLAMLRQIFGKDEVIDGWYYQFVYDGASTYLILSLDPEKPIMKINVSDDTVEECRLAIVGAIMAFTLEWEHYLANIPEGVAVKQYLMKEDDDFDLLSRNAVPLVTSAGSVCSLLMQSVFVNENASQNFTDRDNANHIPFIYALKDRLDRFIDNVWLVNNPI